MVYFTRTVSPRCLPGIQLGIDRMRRIASLSNNAVNERAERNIRIIFFIELIVVQ